MRLNPFHRETQPRREQDLSYLLDAGRPDNRDTYSSFPSLSTRRTQLWANNPAMVDGHSAPASPQKPDSDDENHESRQAVGFWSPELKKTRREVAVMWIRTILLLMVAVLGVLSLYWAVLFRANSNLKALTVYVVDFDGQVPPYNTFTPGQPPLVGPAVTDLAEKTLLTDRLSLGYSVLPPSQFSNDPNLIRLAVYDFHAWAAIIVNANANATTLLRAAVASGNSSYDPTGAMTLVYNTARDQTAVQTYVLPQLSSFVQKFAAEFGPRWAAEVMANTSLSRTNLGAASQAVNPGVAPMMLDLRPFEPPTAVPAVSIGLIYLIIVSFFCYPFFIPIHKKFLNHQPPLKFTQLILYRYLSCLVNYLLLSFSYAIISLAFRIPFWPAPSSPTEPPPPLFPSEPTSPLGATAYGRDTWPVYWMLSFVGMTALGLACENAAMILGQPLVSLWLIFWVITNVATSFYPLELAPGFYGWGYAWPLHQVVDGSRQLLFDLHSKIGLNFGVLAVWVAVGTALFPLCCWFMRWKEQRVK